MEPKLLSDHDEPGAPDRASNDGRRDRRLSSLYTLTAAATRAADVRELCDAALDCLTEMLGVERSAVLLLDQEGGMRFRASRGISDAHRAAVEGHSPWPVGTTNAAPILVSDVEFAPELAHFRARSRSEGIRALAFIPLVHGDELLGKVMLYYGEPHAFSDDEVDAALAVAGQVGFALGARRAARALQEARDGLEQQKRLLETVITSLPVGVVVRDRNGHLLMKNAAAERHKGELPEEVSGHERRVLRRPDGTPLAMAEWPLMRALRGEVVVDDELLWPRRLEPREDVTHLVLSAAPVRDERGQVVAAVTTFRDVTEERRAEQRRADHARFLEQFVGIVGHDLRSPLTAIQMAAGLLSHTELGEPQHRAVQRVLASTVRAERLIRDLLDFAQARIGAGIPVTRAPIDLHEVARQIVEEHTDGPGRRRIALECTGDARGAWDPNRMAQVLSNLLGNALQYSPAASEVRVTVDATGDDVVITTCNGGRPIPPSLLPRIFEPFFRATAPNGDHPRSVGLGLYIVREIVRAHGGTVVVTSSAETGTCFRIVLARR